jgi:hypothetical protein
MHTHVAFFWLNDGLDEEQHSRFRKGLDLLTKESHVRERSIGQPSATNRDVVDSTYSYAIVLKFEDLVAHNAYQVSDAHQVFADTCFDMIKRVQVYDID